MSEEAAKKDVIYVRLRNEKNMRWVLLTMADSKQPMRAVIEKCVEFSRRSKHFHMPTKKTTDEETEE